MNSRASGGGWRKMGGAPPPNRSKERDEDLLLFREMYKREKDRVVSLLQPVSDEFEPTGTGNHAFYRMGSAKKGPGAEFLAESEKNDYDWLKTPPATPLFPSLEMEANAPEMVVQREIPILQPLSRFAGNSEAAAKASSGRPKTPNPKPKVPARSVTPSGRLPTTMFTNEKKNIKSAPIMNHKMIYPSITTSTATTSTSTSSAAAINATVKSKNQRESHLNFLSSNLSKSIDSSSKTNPRGRGVSPSVRSTIPAQIPGFSDEIPRNLKTDRSNSVSRGPAANISNHLKPESITKSIPAGFSDETPPNLKTDRSNSVSRGRPANLTNVMKPESVTKVDGLSDETPPNLKTDRSTSTSRGRPANPINPQKQESVSKAIRRQSCSPSVTRGRKVAPNQEAATVQKGRIAQNSGNGAQVLGSRMVDRFLNARKTSAEERETKPKLYGSINESSGFGRMISRSSLDMAVKHMEIKGDHGNFRQPGSTTGRKPATK